MAKKKVKKAKKKLSDNYELTTKSVADRLVSAGLGTIEEKVELNKDGTVKMPEMPIRKKEDVYTINGRPCEIKDLGGKDLWNAIDELNQRIDSIINAHEKCKSLKGL